MERQPTADHVLYLDIREQLIESYGDTVNVEYTLWDNWEDCDPTEYTPYDIAAELIADPHACDSTLRSYAAWRKELPHLSKDEHFQSNISELVLNTRVSNPIIRDMMIRKIELHDGYLKVHLTK